MKRKKILATLLAGVMLTSAMLSGCGPKNPSEGTSSNTGGNKTNPTVTEGNKNKDTEKPVELTFYMSNSPVNDLDRIMEKANKIIGEKIGAKLDLILIDGSTYADKMNLMINSGDKWDLCFTANWGGINFADNASKGAYADLTELLPKYAPETYSRIPKGLWDAVTIKGKIYASVNYQQWGAAARKGLKFRRDLVDEVGFDWQAVKGKAPLEAMKMIDPFIGKALEKHPDMIGWETSSYWSFYANEPIMWDMENIGDVTTPGWIRFNEPNTVINQFATPEFEEYVNIMKEWYDKGYVRADGATINDTSPDRKAAKFVAEYAQGWPDSVDFPGNQDTEKMSMCTPENAPALTVSTSRTVIPANAGSTAAVAVNAKSKNIEKAVQLIELLNTDDELYMLITQGEEGVDYVYGEDGAFTQVEGKFNFNWNEWQIGQSYSPNFTRALYHKNESGDKQKESQAIVFKADKEADVSPLSGFTFDPTPVKTQLANCSSITTELVPALSAGSVDPAKILPELLKRLEDAGINDIIKEKQAQIDAWKASK
ncbi:ABC transporter substrate-binding protein [Lachnoclostridium sp.]|uniref:ABC transporter substrate-binding protein n=1 Tax=Lachnoclostridium sp. TaxID=2028282 RepID=UPI0028A00A8D|nr:ABC transporter substrate-binding protein [Lachnoclostridium sp.]